MYYVLCITYYVLRITYNYELRIMNYEPYYEPYYERIQYTPTFKEGTFFSYTVVQCLSLRHSFAK